MNQEKLLEYYEKELQFLREMGSEFAERFPGTAAQLDLGGFKCADPYVERLLEGFAFLTARVQLKIDAEYPRFTQNLMNMVYPHYLSPLPSMAIVKFEADMAGNLGESGFCLEKKTRLRTAAVSGRSRCDFRTAHEVMLWPVDVKKADYLKAGEAGYYLNSSAQTRSGIRLNISVAESVELGTLAMDELVFYLDGTGETPSRIYELLLAHTHTVVVKSLGKEGEIRHEVTLDNNCLQPVGFNDDESMLPLTDVSFKGYRLLQEYYAFPERFLFVRLSGLQQIIQRCSEEDAELEIVILCSHDSSFLEDSLNSDNFVLHCSPAINLFPKRADRIHVSNKINDHHVIIDRTAVQDYEIYSIDKVIGFDDSLKESRQFLPFYERRSAKQASATSDAYFTWRRDESLLPVSSRKNLNYAGSEVFLSLVDAKAAPWSADLKQLGVEVMCTNRALPLEIAAHKGRVNFTMEDAAPVNAVVGLAGPTKPVKAWDEGEHAWRLVNHLSLNYLSLLDKDAREGASALRELMRLYSHSSSPSVKKQIDGVLSVCSKSVVQRIPGAGPIAFGRGTEIELNCQESAFDGIGVFVLGSVLEQFFAKYVSVNSFTQLVLSSTERGELMRWPVRTGTAPIL